MSTHYGKVVHCPVAESLPRTSQRSSSRLLPFSLPSSLCALSEQWTLGVKFWGEWKFLKRKINARKARSVDIPIQLSLHFLTFQGLFSSLKLSLKLEIVIYYNVLIVYPLKRLFIKREAKEQKRFWILTVSFILLGLDASNEHSVNYMGKK